MAVLEVGLTVMVTVCCRLLLCLLPPTLKDFGDTSTVKELPASAEPAALNVSLPSLLDKTDLSVRWTVIVPATSPAIQGTFMLSAAHGLLEGPVGGGDGDGFGLLCCNSTSPCPSTTLADG